MLGFLDVMVLVLFVFEGFLLFFCGGLLFIFLNMNIMPPPKLSHFSKCY